MQTQSHILPTGTSLDKDTYTIVRHLGSGGFGITYLATNRLGRNVVIKEMYLSGHCVRNTDTYAITLQNLEPDAYERHRERFRHEGLALLKFNHPNIVRVEELFEENGTLYLVMEYIDGDNIEQIKERQGAAFSVDETLKVGRQMIEALHEVHGQNVFHRDVKPANVMVDRHGAAKLIDFGISKQVDENITMTQTKAFSKYYAPPEQQAGTKPSSLFDTYSLGGTLYFMLTGERPKDVSERATDEFLSPNDLNPTIPLHISNAVMKALSLKPAERWQSIREFGAALGNPAYTGSGTNAGPAPSDDKTRIDDQGTSRQQIRITPAAASQPPPQEKERSRAIPFWLKSVMYGIIITFGGVGIGLMALRYTGVSLGDENKSLSQANNITPAIDTAWKTAPIVSPPAEPVAQPVKPAQQPPATTYYQPEKPSQPAYVPPPPPPQNSGGRIADGLGQKNNSGTQTTSLGMGGLVGQWSSRDDENSYAWNFGGTADGGKFTLNLTQKQDGNIIVYFKMSGMWQKTGSNTINTRYAKVNCTVDVDGEKFDLRNMDAEDLDGEERGQLQMLVTIMDALEGESVNYTVRSVSSNAAQLVDGAGTVSSLRR